MIRIDFPGGSGGESLEPVSWEEWFAVFDERGLALVYQESMVDGTPSRFNKIVSRSAAMSGSKGSGKDGRNGKNKNHQISGGKRTKNMPNSGNTPGGRKGKEKKLPRR